jgi:hypothetical protein
MLSSSPGQCLILKCAHRPCNACALRPLRWRG